jgi:hypothetical protein
MEEIQMKAQEAAQIIDTITNALKENPNQFNLSINMSGFSSHVTGGGIGAIGIADQGGCGIHATVYMENSNMNIINEKANEKLNEEITNLLNQLASISKELKNDDLNKSKIYTIYEKLKNTWVPGVITSVIDNLLTMVFGLHK